MSAFDNPKRNEQENTHMMIQPQLEVGKKDDEHEKEADAMADKVMRMSDKDKDDEKIMKMSDGPQVQCMHDEEEEGKISKMSDGPEVQRMHDGTHKISRMSDGNEKGMTAPASVEAGINSTKGNGQSLPGDIQQEMGSKMGADLSNVKVHTDGQAAQMNKDINAKAFTHGQDIYFNQGQYNPSTSQGKHLLAHELTHTMQQGNGVQRKVMKKGADIGPYFNYTVQREDTLYSIVRKLYSDVKLEGAILPKIVADIKIINGLSTEKDINVKEGQILKIPERKGGEERIIYADPKKKEPESMTLLGQRKWGDRYDQVKYILVGDKMAWSSILSNADEVTWELYIQGFIDACIYPDYVKTKTPQDKYNEKLYPTFSASLVRLPNIHEIKEFLRALFNQGPDGTRPMSTKPKLAFYSDKAGTYQNSFNLFLGKYMWLITDDFSGEFDQGKMTRNHIAPLASATDAVGREIMIQSALASLVGSVYLVIESNHENKWKYDTITKEHKAGRMAQNAGKIIRHTIDAHNEDYINQMTVYKTIFEFVYDAIPKGKLEPIAGPIKMLLGKIFEEIILKVTGLYKMDAIGRKELYENALITSLSRLAGLDKPSDQKKAYITQDQASTFAKYFSDELG